MRHHGDHETMLVDHGMSWMPMLMSSIVMVCLLAVLAGGLLFAHRRGLLPTARTPRALAAAPAGRHAKAEEWLDMALAKGEIDVAEYHERRAALRSADL